MVPLEEGRNIVNWKTADWQPYPGLDGDRPELTWNPIRAAGTGGDGFYLLRLAPGSGGKLHRHDGVETFVVLEGELTDSDGRVLREGDCVAYAPGTRHQTHTPGGCILLAWIPDTIESVEGDPEIATMQAGRTVVNWHEAEFDLYPSLPPGADPIQWHPIRAVPETGEGFYLVTFPKGARSAEHEHTGPEHFIMLAGELHDPDGTVYRTGDCVALEPGTVHTSHSPKGCVTAAFIGGPLRTLE